MEESLSSRDSLGYKDLKSTSVMVKRMAARGRVVNFGVTKTKRIDFTPPMNLLSALPIGTGAVVSRLLLLQTVRDAEIHTLLEAVHFTASSCTAEIVLRPSFHNVSSIFEVHRPILLRIVVCGYAAFPRRNTKRSLDENPAKRANAGTARSRLRPSASRKKEVAYHRNHASCWYSLRMGSEAREQD